MYNKDNYSDTENTLNEALKSDPGFILPDNFAERMADKMGRRFAWSQYLNEFLIYLGTVVGMVVVPAILAFVWYGASWNLWLGFVLANAVWITGTIVLLLFILFADRVLLQYFLYRSATEKN